MARAILPETERNTVSDHSQQSRCTQNSPLQHHLGQPPHCNTLHAIAHQQFAHSACRFQERISCSCSLHE